LTDQDSSQQGEVEMALISEQGFNIKRGKEEAFQKWITDNDAAIKKSTPPGIEYLGTYVVTMTSEKQAGEYRVLLRLDSFATFDASHEAARDEKSEWGRLNRELTKFMDIPIGGEFSFSIYRPLIDAVMWDVS
jgi:antibiotic biosynthesis monooxygenase (ABM) superfamily enzyme